MTRIAFFNIPARGHLDPTIPIVNELVSQGVEVHYFTGDAYRDLVEAAGSTFHSLPTLKRLGGNSTDAVPAPDDRQIALMPFAMGLQAPEVIPKLVEELRSLQPDCLVYNVLSLWPRLVSRILNIPSIGFRPFHAPRQSRLVTAPVSSDRLARIADDVDRGLAALMASFRLPSVTLTELVSHVDQLTLMFLVRELQHDADAFDERFLFVGPSLTKQTPEPWPIPQCLERQRARVYVSLGTMRNDDSEFYRMCFSAFPRDEWEVVMSVGDHVDLNLLAPIPDNFFVARAVRQTAILPHSDLFVTHGGLNSVMESLAFGVPMVVIPSIKEQELTARRLSVLRLGVVVDRKSITATTLSTHAAEVLSDDDTANQLKTFRAKIVSAGGYRHAVQAIVGFGNI